MESKSQKLTLDIQELEKLSEQATRKSVKDILSIQLSRLNTQLQDAHESEKQESTTKQTPKESIATPKSYTVTIRNYSWDESDKFMKIYVTLKNIQALNEDKVTTKFTESGFTLNVLGLDNKDHCLTISRLAGAVNPASSYHKIKTDMIAVMIAKAQPGRWESVTLEEKKAKIEKMSKMDTDNKDPSASLMSMMKQMYDDGDDNMKRMLNKSWYESKKKQASGADLMGDL